MVIISEKKEPWLVKWELITGRMGQLIAREGKKMVIYNVEAGHNIKKQFKKFTETAKRVKNQLEAVVTTSLPGEERIFWPYKDAQFYIREGKEQIGSTGNPKAIQEIINFNDESINTDIPVMDFWKNEKINFRLDKFNYVDETKLFDKNFTLNLPKLLEKYPHQETLEFENKPFWYLLKFLRMICS